MARRLQGLRQHDAHALGLVNHITTPGRLEAEGLKVAGRLSSLPRATLVGLKRAIIAFSEDFENIPIPFAQVAQVLAIFRLLGRTP